MIYIRHSHQGSIHINPPLSKHQSRHSNQGAACQLIEIVFKFFKSAIKAANKFHNLKKILKWIQLFLHFLSLQNKNLTPISNNGKPWTKPSELKLLIRNFRDAKWHLSSYRHTSWTLPSRRDVYLQTSIAKPQQLNSKMWQISYPVHRKEAYFINNQPIFLHARPLENGSRKSP